MNEPLGILVALPAGVISFLSPCVMPLVPSYLSFVTGMSLEDLQEGVDRRAILAHSLLFVSGFSIIFIVGGATASFIGGFLQYYQLWIARIGGVLIIVLGLHLIGVFRIVPLMRERRIQVRDKPAGYIGTLGVGAAFGAGWTPCLGPVLGGLFMLAGTQETVWSGMLLLGFYSLGLAIPFLISALALDWFLAAFSHVRQFLPIIEKGSGVMLVLVGLLLITGAFTLLNEYLVRFTPEWVLQRI